MSARLAASFSELARLVGRSTAGLVQMLDAIRVGDRIKSRPDIASLGVTVRTGLPPGMARAELEAAHEAVFRAWADAR